MSWQWLVGTGGVVVLIAAGILWCAHQISKAFSVDL